MRRARTCCSSSTTSSDSPRPAQRCLLFSAVFPVPSATSPPWPRTWHRCRSASPRPRRAPSPPCRPSTCPRTILPTPPRPRPSRTWTPRRCCPGRSPSWASTLRWTLSTPPPACWTPPSLASATTTSREARRRSSRTTSPCRTSSPFWAWTSFPRRISSSSLAPARCSASCPSPSSWPRSSRAPLVPSWRWRRCSATSRRCLRAIATTFLRRPST
mmetsp:Transcript_102257/g.266739  ORF Transcript_102257/g.266739 Transcript_102257/m.266739 type:complete len:215 (-) Transcript_102257:137-781(-)